MADKQKTKKTKKEGSGAEQAPTVIKGETCPVCHKKTLTLSESEIDIPYFGKTYLFSMNCSDCGYHKADVEAEEKKQGAKYTLEISSEKDMNTRIVKSSHAKVKIPRIGGIEPGEAANGYITNVEGILGRLKRVIESIRDESEDDSDKKKAKNKIKKLSRIMWGRDKAKIIIEDPTGNSAIISDKTKKEKL